MKLSKLSVYFTLFTIARLQGQNEGNKWVIGYSSSNSPHYSVMYLDFTNSKLEIDWHFDETLSINETASSICNSAGEVVLFTNGMRIYGKNGTAIVDTIAFQDDILGYWNWFYNKDYGPFGFPRVGGAIILPLPGGNLNYSVFYHYANYHGTLGFPVNKFLETRLQLNQDSSFQILFQDSTIGPTHEYLSPGIVATKHANGRDWWLINLERDGNKYFTYLFDPSGIKLFRQDSLSVSLEGGLGQTTFSNNGNYLVRIDAFTLNRDQNINLFSFDRCNGEVNYIETFHTTAGNFAGVAFSQNERFLYADDNTHLWQWDLLANDIALSQTLIDTFDGFIQPGWFGMDFGPMQTAPDGRIYIIPSAGSSNFMHVINSPNHKGSESKFVQHAIDLTVSNGRSAPNIPNFKLGSLDGSSCDTLGIDNFPKANWRFEENIPGEKRDILFTDLSYYEPDSWLWEFGDGSTSNEISPTHIFDNGLFNVCLTVSNSNGSDSLCRWVEILPTNTEYPNSHDTVDLSIYPNPFTNELHIKSRTDVFESVQIEVYDIHGHLILNESRAPIPVNLHFTSLPSGMYFIKIKRSTGLVISFKAMKL